MIPIKYEPFLAIDTIRGKVYFTTAELETLASHMERSKFIVIGDCAIATGQIVEVRQPTGLEYFQQKIAKTLPRSYSSKVNAWIAALTYDPTIEQIMTKIEEFSQEVNKYKEALREFTPEELAERKKAVEEMKNKLKNKI